MLITKELIISISNNQKTRYLNLGYEIINGKSTIKIEDLPKFSRHTIFLIGENISIIFIQSAYLKLKSTLVKIAKKRRKS